jgi:hypothetical protein
MTYITHPSRASWPQDSHWQPREVLHEVTGLPFTLQLVKGPYGVANYGVIYGKQIELGLTAEEAGTRFGYCLVHALSYAGKVEF